MSKLRCTLTPYRLGSWCVTAYAATLVGIMPAAAEASGPDAIEHDGKVSGPDAIEHDGKVPFPDLIVTKHTLDNALRVVLQEDHSTPTVAICLTYATGSRNEDRDGDGTAELVERKLGGCNVPASKDEPDMQITAAGGTVSSTLTGDLTAVCESLPSNALGLGLWLEANRMKSLADDAERFEHLRRTAIAEAGAAAEANGSRTPSEALSRLVFEGFWPYEHPAQASPADLEAVELERTQEFYRLHYATHDAVLSLAGDFDGTGILSQIERYFGVLTDRPGDTSFDGNVRIPPQTSERLDVIRDASYATPAVFYGWRIPPSSAKEHRALELAVAILADGESSRLVQGLVMTSARATAVSAWTSGHTGPDLLGIAVAVSPHSSVDKVQAVVEEEIKRLRTSGPSPVELAKAKTRLRSRMIAALETNQERASWLGAREASAGDAASPSGVWSTYAAITGDDIRRAVAAHLGSDARSIVEVYPPSWREDGATAGDEDPHPAPRIYKVRTGDSLSAIADHFRTSVGNLASLNHLDPKKQIIAGQKLVIPAVIDDDPEGAPEPVAHADAGARSKPGHTPGNTTANPKSSKRDSSAPQNPKEPQSSKTRRAARKDAPSKRH